MVCHRPDSRIFRAAASLSKIRPRRNCQESARAPCCRQLPARPSGAEVPPRTQIPGGHSARARKHQAVGRQGSSPSHQAKSSRSPGPGPRSHAHKCRLEVRLGGTASAGQDSEESSLSERALRPPGFTPEAGGAVRTVRSSHGPASLDHRGRRRMGEQSHRADLTLISIRPPPGSSHAGGGAPTPRCERSRGSGQEGSREGGWKNRQAHEQPEGHDAERPASCSILADSPSTPRRSVLVSDMSAAGERGARTGENRVKGVGHRSGVVQPPPRPGPSPPQRCWTAVQPRVLASRCRPAPPATRERGAVGEPGRTA